MSNVCHVEIPTINLEKSKEFYSKLFEWKIDTESLPNYGLVNEKVSIGFPIVKEIPENIRRVYVQVNSIEEVLKSAEELGGSVVNPKSLISQQIGYSASFKDPEGNIIGLFAND